MKALPIIGWYGRHNSGDEAFRDVHRLILPEMPLTWLHPGLTPAFQPPAEQRDDIVLVSAGDIISSFYFDWIPPSARIVVYGAGVAWDAEIEFLGRIKDRLAAVWVRNERDVARLREQGVPAFYTPDIVFNLTPLMTPAAKSPGRKRAYVMVTDSPRADALRTNDLARFFHLQSFFCELTAGLDFLSEWYDLVLVPFSFDRNDFDLAAIYDLLPRLRARDNVEIIDRELTPLEMINFLGGADLVVTTKFHGVVYSIMNEVPFVAISDTRKVRLICEDNGFGNLWQPMKGMQAGAFKRALGLAESDENRVRLAAVKASLVARAAEEAEKLKKLLST